MISEETNPQTNNEMDTNGNEKEKATKSNVNGWRAMVHVKAETGNIDIWKAKNAIIKK